MVILDAPILSFNNGISLTKDNQSINAYYAKFNSNGICQFANKMSGISEVDALNLTVDDLGDFYITGRFLDSFSILNINLASRGLLGRLYSLF